jgi:enoyl-CoA hydratase
MSSPTEILLEVAGARATVTFRTESGVNVLAPAVIEQLGRVVSEIDRRDDVRAVVFRAEGKAFLAGADIKAMREYDRQTAHDMSVAGHSAFALVENLAPITVAAIHATAAGGGCELALACDFRIAVKDARIGQPETLLGLIPGWGGTVRLAKLVGPTAAKWLIFSGKLITGEEAAKLALVDRVVDSADQLTAAVDEFLTEFVKAGPQAIALAKRAIHQGGETDHFSECFAGDEAREGMTAFLEKRAAAWAEQRI